MGAESNGDMTMVTGDGMALERMRMAMEMTLTICADGE